MLKQSLSQKLLQKLSPQQIQFIKLLQLNTQDFEEKVDEELLDNPALEEGEEEDYIQRENKLDSNIDSLNDDFEKNTEDYFKNDDFDLSDYMEDRDDMSGFKMGDDYGSTNEDEAKELPIANYITFHENLEDQAKASNFSDKDLKLALHLIGSIEEDGYLRRDLKAICNDLAFTEGLEVYEEDLERILIKIQNFEPAGIGARNLQECLLLQLYKKDYGNNPAIDLAEKILVEHMDNFTKKHYDKIKKSLKITDDQLKYAINEIIKLNPKPGETELNIKTQYIIPDFIIINNDDVLSVVLNSRNAPDLRVNQSFTETLQAYDKSKANDAKLKEAVQYIKQKLDGAKWFIDSVKQRQNTLMSTMQAILDEQYDYFLTGDESELKPMILKNIAEKVNLDISTISRVASSKYVETDFGIIPLKFFFSEGIINNDGEEVSNREVKKILSEAVASENKSKPITDEVLMELLKEKGYNIARRTVAKYREQLNIPVARLRKEL